MADKTVTFELLIDASKSATSIGDIKKSIKDLSNAALEAGAAGNDALATKLTAAAGMAKDKIVDFKNELNATSDAGSKLGAIAKVGQTIAGGFAAAQGAAALFGSSGEDVQKVMMKVQAATALVAGAQALANVQEDIAIAGRVVYTTVTNIAGAASKLFGISAAAGMAMATAGITVVITALVGLIAYLSMAGDESEELAKKEEARKEKAAAANAFLTEQQERDLIHSEERLAILQKEGAGADKILAAENEILDIKIKQNKEAQKTTNFSDEGRAEKYKLDTQLQQLESEKKILNTKEASKKEVAVKVETNKKLLKTDEQLFKEAEELKKKQADDFAALTEKEYSDSIKNTSEYYDHLIALAKLNNEDTTALENKKAEELIVIGDEYGQKTLAQQDALNLEKKKQKEDAAKKEVDDAVKLAQENLSGGVGGSELANQIALENALYEQAKIANTNLEQLEREHIAKIEGLKKASALKSVQAGLKMAQDSLSAIQNITDIAYIGKLSRVKKGSKEEEVILRKQFETNKKMQIASAIINGALAITNIIATVPKADFGIATAVMLVASASATAASIAKIASTKFEGGGGGGSVDIPNITAPPETSAPSIQNQSLLGNDQSTQAGTKVFVTESDIKKVTGRVSVIENQARFG